MTEAEWLACADPKPMLEFLCGKASDRKLRLFACACCRREPQLTDPQSWRAVESCERFADGLASTEELEEAQLKAEAAALAAAAGGARDAAARVAWTPVGAAYREASGAAYLALAAAQLGPPAAVDLLRDLCGNPFRPLRPRPEAIAALAEEIYAGAWDRMPLLGEWLQEHGFWTEGEHCLDLNLTHVKGCWVVDWVTGRE
jgi:hypothetical protein